MWDCKICNQKISKNYFSQHLKRFHQETPECYTLKYLNNNQQTFCRCGCGGLTLYVKKEYRFNDYIHNHHKPTLGKTMKEETKVKISYKQKLFQSSLTEKQRKNNTKNAINAAKQKWINCYGIENVFLLQKHTWTDILQKSEAKGYIANFNYKEYKNNNSIVSFICKVHNLKFDTKIGYLFRDTDKRQCPLCKKQFSFAEKEISSVLENLAIIKTENDRNVLNGQELDIFIPEKNIGIEFNGLYWHSELYKNKNYHFEKFKKCKDKGIKLFQIYEDEWCNKQDIWKSVIVNSLGLCKNKLNARELFVDDNPNSLEIKTFLNNNHLQGYCKSIKNFVLKDKDKNIVYCITLRKPFTKRYKNSLEIARVACCTHMQIRGAFSRLMKYVLLWAKNNQYENIITYSDCRYSWGEVYSKYGFEFVGHTGPGYDYTDGTNRFFRFKFRAQNGHTEKQVAKQNNIYRIYNSGNYIWKYYIK